MIEEKGRVVAVDLQEGCFGIRKKIKGPELEQKIIIIKFQIRFLLLFTVYLKKFLLRLLLNTWYSFQL